MESNCIVIVWDVLIPRLLIRVCLLIISLDVLALGTPHQKVQLICTIWGNIDCLLVHVLAHLFVSNSVAYVLHNAVDTIL